MESQADRSVWNCWNIAAEQGDSSSAEEVESPRSVVAAARRAGGGLRRWRKAGDQSKESSKRSTDNSKRYLHSQVLRIKEEELQIGEDFVGDYCSTSDDFVANPHPLDDRVVIWSRAILPASPLGANKNKRND